MSALSAIETPVVAAQEARSQVATELGPSGRPLRVVGGPERRVADQGRQVATGEGRPRSSSIPATGSQAPARPLTAPRAVPASAVAEAPSSAPPPSPDGARVRTARMEASPPRARTQATLAADARIVRRVTVVPGSVISSPRTGVRPMSAGPRAPLRLTRRGRIVVAALVLVGATVATLLITLLAPGGAQATNHGPARAGYQGMHQVVVQPGQTLWSIAAAAQPSADPRTVIQEIMSANALSGPAISAGQLLWVP
jgi:hypothetical protein